MSLACTAGSSHCLPQSTLCACPSPPAPPSPQECHVQHPHHRGPFSHPCWQGERAAQQHRHPIPPSTHPTTHHTPHSHHTLTDPLLGLEATVPGCVCVRVLHCPLHRVLLGRPAGVVRGDHPTRHLHLLHPPDEDQQQHHGPARAAHLQVTRAGCCQAVSLPSTPAAGCPVFGVCTCVFVFAPRCCRHPEVTPQSEDTTESSRRSLQHLPIAQSGSEGAGHVASVASGHVKVLGWPVTAVC